MKKTLGRDLGLYSVFMISIGAMVGSGIFVLPGLARYIGGPAVILAYFLAGLIVLPAALSKAEMATAMPEAGGTYIYINRSLGPMMGTIAGIGVWFSLTFKSAFALVGLGAYLLLFAENLPTKPVALALAVIIIAVNMIGVKQTARLQAIIVSGVLLVLVFFIAEGVTVVEQVNFHPFFLEGIDGLLAATGFIFVSYAGVTKIASIAEEVENPGRNIPLGILGSIAIMMLIYTAIIFVIVGVTDAEQLGKSLTPMAIVAEQFLGSTGVVVITITAVLALTSMANAGVLSSSRYPFAMSRDNLAPEVFKQIHVNFKTPVFSIGVTGGLLLLLITFVPVVELAKLASAFKILIFSLINVALIVFRESNLESYQPTFRSPGYPWVQLFGILGGVVLLTQMGTFPMLGAVGIIVGGIAWYQFYGKSRTTQKGVALKALRQSIASRNLAEAKVAIAQNTPSRILIPVHPYITLEQKETLVQIAADLVRKQGGEIQVVRLIEVPEQMSLQAAAEVETQEDIEFVAQVKALAQKYGVQIEAHELVSHDLNRAVVNYTRQNQINLIIGEVEARFGHIPLFGNDVEWLMDHVPCDSIFVKNRGVGRVQKIAVIGENRPYESVEIVTANTIALEHRASIHFIHALKKGASDTQVAALKSHHEEVAKLCLVPTSSQVIRVDERVDALKEITSEFDLIIVNASAHHFSPNHIFGDFTDRMAQHMNCSVLLAHDKNAHRRTFLWQALQRVIR